MSIAQARSAVAFYTTDGGSPSYLEDALETLEKVRELLADSAHWAKGALAKRTKYSRTQIDVHNPEAGAFCLYGAIKKVDGPGEHLAAKLLSMLVTESYVYSSRDPIIQFNDTESRRHKDILNKLDQTITFIREVLAANQVQNSQP